MINEAPWNLWKLKTWGIKSPWKELKDGTNLIAVAQFVCIKKSAQGSKIEIAEKVRNEGKNELLYQLQSHAVAKQKELDFYLNFPWITSAMQLQCKAAPKQSEPQRHDQLHFQDLFKSFHDLIRFFKIWARFKPSKCK